VAAHGTDWAQAAGRTAVSGAVRHAVRAAGVASAVAALAGLGLPAVAVAAGVVVVLPAAACWVVSSRDRSDRLAGLTTACRQSQ